MRGTAFSLTIWFAMTAAALAAPSQHRDFDLAPLSFGDLSGWPDDNHAEAWTVFRKSCEKIVVSEASLREARMPSPVLRDVCKVAVSRTFSSRTEARRFFETYFEPYAVLPKVGEGFLTGYYEPQFEGSREATSTFNTPILGRPSNLISLSPGETFPGVDPSIRGVMRTQNGFEPYWDRTAIETGKIGNHAKAIAYVREPGEAFIIHVQGSARLLLPGGEVLRLAYAGRNGQPYTSIGRLLIERGAIAANEMSLERLMAWLRNNPVEARSLMRRNRSYIFFREASEVSTVDGPIGGAGIPLTPQRSLAVDRSLYAYGLLFWLEGSLPLATGGAERLARLMIAQDTGSAIIGPARGDFFFGSGTEAGTRAGLLRHPARFVVLQPKAPGP